MALLSVFLTTLLLDVVGSLAILLVLEAALLAGDSLLDRFLGDLTFPLLDISTDGVGDIMAFPPGDGVIHSLGDLLTDFLGDLAANMLWSLPNNRREGRSLGGRLQRQPGEMQMREQSSS